VSFSSNQRYYLLNSLLRLRGPGAGIGSIASIFPSVGARSEMLLLSRADFLLNYRRTGESNSRRTGLDHLPIYRDSGEHRCILCYRCRDLQSLILIVLRCTRRRRGVELDATKLCSLQQQAGQRAENPTPCCPANHARVRTSAEGTLQPALSSSGCVISDLAISGGHSVLHAPALPFRC